MASKTYGLTPEIQNYLRDVSVREHPAQTGLRKTTAEMAMSVMQASPEMGNFMQLLVSITGATRCIEVGVFTGYSALSVALSLPEHGVIRAFDISEEWTQIGLPYWEEAGVTGRIDLKIGPASEGLQALIDAGEGETYDFAFIDANKVGYPQYYTQCMQLVRPGGMLLLDNTLWNWEVANPAVSDPETEAIREVNRMIYEDARVLQSIIPFGDGCTLVMKK